MKRLQSFLLAFLLFGAVTSPAWADNDRGNPDRGRVFSQNDNIFAHVLASGRVPAGQADSAITVTPTGGSSQSAMACSTIPSAWAGPLRGSRWVSLQADCTTSLADSTNYVYSTTFNMPPNHDAARISGQVIADDSVTIQLNDTTIFTGGGFGSPTTFSSNDSSLFVAGTNTLTFTVFNVTAESGLDYVARVEAARELPFHTFHSDNNGDD
jgi:hypothetical protein